MGESINFLSQESNFISQKFVSFYQFLFLTVVPLKEAKDRGFQDLIFNSCLEALENDTVPQVNVGLLFNKNMIADNLCTYLVSH